MDTAIATRGLTKRFGALTAVESLDLDVHSGEVFGFLGPNGAGKTTTIRLLLDILRPSAGDATVLGAPPGDHSVRSWIGFLPGELHFGRRGTVAETLEFLGTLRGGVDQRDVDNLLERFDLDVSRRIGELSTGNRRKVGVVQAFAGRPELLILDEPTGGLDPLLQHELLALIRERVADGATVFFSSHVLPEVERVADRVGILRTGRLVLVDGIDALRSRARQHVELYVAQPVDAAAFGGLPGVVDVTVQDGVVSMIVEGSIDPVVKQAAELTVERITTRELDLEDVFLELYR